MSATHATKVRAQMNGTHARICVDGLIEFPTEDGPEYWACHGCGGCTPTSAQPTGPVRDRTALATAAAFAGASDDEAF